MNLQVIVGNGLVNLIFDAYGDDERCYSIDSASFTIMTERLVALAKKEQGHDLMGFNLYENEIPFEDEGNA